MLFFTVRSIGVCRCFCVDVFHLSHFLLLFHVLLCFGSATDVDSSGEPGFVSDKTGKPAALYHVEFPEDLNHPYANLLVQSQDLEEYELLNCLLPEEEVGAAGLSPARKKARK